MAGTSRGAGKAEAAVNGFDGWQIFARGELLREDLTMLYGCFRPEAVPRDPEIDGEKPSFIRKRPRAGTSLLLRVQALPRAKHIAISLQSEGCRV